MKKALIKLLAVLALVSVSVFSAPALAVDCTQSGLSTQQAIQCGACSANGSCQTPAQANTKIDNTIANVINILTDVIGIVAVIMIIIGGFRYITSSGSTEKVTNAKNTILYAIIGLVVVALAKVIARFVLDKATH